MVEAPSLWFETLSKSILNKDFIVSKFDPCLFINPSKNIIILVYVDDCLLFGKDEQCLNNLIQSFRNKHPLTNEDVGDNVYDYLGIEVSKNNNKILYINKF